MMRENCGVMQLRIGEQRARQPRRRMIEPLARQRQELVGIRQRARRRAQLGAARLLAALPAGERAAREAVDLRR